MKNSRNIVVILALLMMAGIFTKACGDDFLTRPSMGSLSEDVLNDRTGVETLLLGAYAALSQTGDQGWGDGLPTDGAWIVCPSNWLYGSVMGTEAHKGSDAGDQPQMNTLGGMNVSPTTGFINLKWRGLYEGIARANSVLKVLPNVPIVEGTFTEVDRARFEAEARFIRGHFYFELARFFNRVPWIDENTDALTPQPNDQDVWPMIEADFRFAFDNLPETQGQVGRPNSWAAASYLAKSYMYQNKFSDAKALYDQIIPNGRTSNGLAYDLVQLDQIHNPVHKNHAESIFAIQASANDGTGTIQNANPGMMLNYPYNSPFRCCGFYQPTQFLVNAYQTVDGLPMVGNHLATNVRWDMGILSNQQFTPHEGALDPRLDYTVGRRGVPFHDWGPHPGERWIRDQAYSGPYAAKKHIWWQKDDQDVNNPSQWAPGTSYNIPIIRFADVLLMAAEAEIEVGSLGQALQYINRVRARAANPAGWVRNEFNEEFAHEVVGSQAEMLALTPSSGSWVVRTDTGTTFVYLGGGAANISNWNEYEVPNYEIALYTDLGNQAQARNIVRFERKLELSLEGHRFFDLNRWGIGQDEINRFMDYEGAFFPASYLNEGRYTSNKNEYFPIPQRQIDLSTVGGVPQLQQNQGY
ncbi:MAG: RagB/SusD family nutrient uptake outer membrane protein [Balneolaceae bacterium]|nr:MAG: RagB/SusD family nutrient uptake outer membrane protein [Balneolaceae bacterium]